jgi:hypothetical protein
MSHDRGCWCGRERFEYASCPDEKCFKKKKCDVVFDFHSPHNNEYWYKCNTCGATDWFAYYHRDKVKRDEPLKDCEMRDTDWRPSVCPDCGVMRAAAEYPVCKNEECKEYGRGGPDKVERTMIKSKEPKQYLWVKSGKAPTFVTDITELYRHHDFDTLNDKIYEVGQEVRLKVTIEKDPVYRSEDPRR